MTIKKLFLVVLLASAVASAAASAAEQDPEAFVRAVSSDVIATAKADRAIQAGDIDRVLALVESKVMPHVDFAAATRSAVGPKWREATTDQRDRLQAEFKALLMRLYAGALTQIRDQTIEVVKTQTVPDSGRALVRSEVRGKGEPLKLDYSLDRIDGDWRIVDVSVAGVWLISSYRAQFGQELGKGGIEGLIRALAERNKAAATR